ncbi:MAG: hypothetical protein FWE36_00530 [Erysipelotrichales bacterium]|nr:hypothetical protein [Erysipelotrichales bacterium]
MKRITRLLLIILLFAAVMGSVYAFWASDINSPNNEQRSPSFNIGSGSWYRGITFPNTGSGISITVGVTLPAQPNAIRRMRFTQTVGTPGVLIGSQVFATDSGLRMLIPVTFDLPIFVDENHFNKVVEYNAQNTIRAVTVWRIGTTVPQMVWDFWV